MERRIAKINISSAGGTASSGSKTCKVTLPTSWVREMGINQDYRELEEYNPLAIIENTGGRMAEDQQWLTIKVLE